ncbi:MAG TPA: beta-propeller fold lactonase family protein [Gemmatimonadaceae bacterium]|jgi:6-phosphogluconolactonase (cycloisomerase 2 family)|nr:beta-propeller fold lactonase family protein [Gemmatimonadaceae bacterium]
MHTLSRTVLLLAILGACSHDATSPDGALPRTAALARGGSDVGAVFTLSNSASGNAVIAFVRGADGTLTLAGTFATQGNGTGAGLGSQGAVALSGDGRFLFAVNAASNSITSFAVDGASLTRVSTVASGGTLPISLTTHGNLVYVLNAGGIENITGFSVSQNGGLTMLPGSSRPLSGTGVGPAEVGFDPSGSSLVVTEKNTNRIDVFAVGNNGLASAPVVNASAGQTPFGFAFNQQGVLIVSEAFGGGADASAVSSYTLGTNGTLAIESASVPTTETSACWVAVTNNGKFAYAANTGSSSLTGYRVDHASLTILNADGKTGITGTTAIDVALSRNSQFLYTLTADSHSISAFSVRQNDGSLTPASGASGLPVGTVGLAAK